MVSKEISKYVDNFKQMLSEKKNLLMKDDNGIQFVGLEKRQELILDTNNL